MATVPKTQVEVMTTLKRQRTETLVVTPQVAQRFLRNVEIDHQRKISKPHVAHLAAMMEAGLFLQACHITEAVVQTGRGEETRNVNGMHTLYAVVLSGVSVFAFVEYWRCDDEESYVKLFHSCDTESRKRTPRDCARAFRMGGLVTNQVDDKLLSVFKSAWVTVSKRGRYGHKEGITQYEQYCDATRDVGVLDFVCRMYGVSVPTTLMARTSVVAAIICSYRHDPVVADLFWRAVLTGDARHCDNHTPVIRLRDWLQATALYGRGSISKFKSSSTKEEMFVGCLRAWDAFKIGKSLSKIVVRFRSADARDHFLDRMCNNGEAEAAAAPRG